MMGYVGYLMSVIGVIGRGDIDGLLVGVLDARSERESERQSDGGSDGSVDAVDKQFAEVEHCPSELLSLREGDNLVGDAIMVVVKRH